MYLKKKSNLGSDQINANQGNKDHLKVFLQKKNSNRNQNKLLDLTTSLQTIQGQKEHLNTWGV